MIVVDSSVWIDYFNGRATRQTDALHDWLGKRTVVMGDLILVEVLQGFRSDPHFRRARRLMQAFPIVTMLGPTLAVRSAENYRTLRRRGVTVRKTIDVVIGTYCSRVSNACVQSTTGPRPPRGAGSAGPRVAGVSSATRRGRGGEMHSQGGVPTPDFLDRRLDGLLRDILRRRPLGKARENRAQRHARVLDRSPGPCIRLR